MTTKSPPLTRERISLILDGGLGLITYPELEELCATKLAQLAQLERAEPKPRARERADVLDFMRHPPGRVPEHLRASLAELARAIERGEHVGSASRLYAPEAELEQTRESK